MVRIDEHDSTPQGRVGIPKKVWDSIDDTAKEVFLEQYTRDSAEEVHRWSTDFLRRMEEAHKMAGDSTLRFGNGDGLDGVVSRKYSVPA